jgi:UDP-glucose 4-epimerase
MISNRALVTGGCGFIGSNIVHELVKQGWHVDVIDDMSNGHLESLEGLKFRSVLVDMIPLLQNQGHLEEFMSSLAIQGDFSHENVLSRVRDKCYDVIIHTAAQPRVEYSVKDPIFTTEVNVLKTVALFKCAADSGTRVIFSSSSAVYGDVERLPTRESVQGIPQSPYALQKLVCEMYAELFSRLYGLDIVSLRYFNVYGPGQLGDSPYSTAISSWCDKLSKNLPLRSDGDGEQSRDLIFVQDIAIANVVAANYPGKFTGEVFNIGTGKSLTNNQILSTLREKIGNFQIENSPERLGDVKHTLADITKATQCLEFNPSIEFEEGLDRTLLWWNLKIEDKNEVL